MPATPRHIEPVAVKDTTAARLLDLSAAEFRRLVDAGALPPPVKIGPHERWRVEQIKTILSGEAARPSEDFDL